MNQPKEVEVKVFSWYPWGFGKWQYQGTFRSSSDADKFITRYKFGCYAIVKDAEVEVFINKIKYRYGQIEPKFPIHHNGETYNRKK